MGVSLSTAGNPTVPFGDFYTSRTYSFVRAECLLEKAEQMVEIIADMVRSASFPEEEVEKVRGRMADYIAFRDARPGALADRLLAARIYGPGPFGSDVLGGEEGDCFSDTIGPCLLQGAVFHRAGTSSSPSSAGCPRRRRPAS